MTVTAVDGTVEGSIGLNIVGAWENVATAANQASGIVTSVSLSSEPSNTGDVLYSVNLRPVVVAIGGTPSFRALSEGAVGPDVLQLLTMLNAKGFYRGTPDNRFGPNAGTAVRAWQRSLGVPVDGIVQVGDVVSVPSLPARIVLATDKIAVGLAVSGSEQAISVLSAQPSFTIPVSAQQSATIRDGTVVQIEGTSGRAWSAVVSGRRASSDSTSTDIDLELSSVSGGSICAADCDGLPATTQTQLSAKLITQPAVRGVLVPTVALQSTNGDHLFVVDSAGHRHSVNVLARANGMSAIHGVNAGTRVRVPTPAQQPG